MYPVALRDEIRTWVEGPAAKASGQRPATLASPVIRLPSSLRRSQHPKSDAISARRSRPRRPCAISLFRTSRAGSKRMSGSSADEWLQRWAPKQCWTAHRMWMELRKLGIPIGESTVRLFVQELRKPMKSAYVPLDFAPGEQAEFDFGEATVKLGGRLVPRPVPGWATPLFGGDVCRMFSHAAKSAPFCSASAMPLSSGEGCHAWRSTITSNRLCSRYCRDIAGESTTCFCTSTVSIALKRF